MQKRYHFGAFENIASKGKKDTFLRLSWDRLKETKKYGNLFRALNHRLVKWEMDEERTILTLKGLCHGSPVHFV